MGDCGFSSQGNQLESANIGGGTLYTLFSTHLMNQSEVVLNAISGGPTQMLENFEDILNDPEHKATIKNEQRKTQQITHLVRQKKISWIGVEVSPLELEKGLKWEELVEDYNGMKSLLSEYITDSNKMDKILSLMYPPYVVAWAKNPKAFDSIKIVPIDDDAAKTESSRLVGEMDRARSELIELGMKKRLLTPEQFFAIDELRLKAMSEVRRITPEETRQTTSQFDNDEVKNVIEKLFSKWNEFYKNSEIRDATMARSVLNQSGDGLVVLGSAHGRGVVNHLNSYCQGNSSSPNETAPASGNSKTQSSDR
tara:strand:+ start:8321 stop:9250 length:930 start_codon:yes stop_codon:yes gene_type:complete